MAPNTLKNPPRLRRGKRRYVSNDITTYTKRCIPNKRAGISLSNKLSIAVLPFVNMSDDPKQEYFSDGMAEEIIGALAKLEGLKVISRTSAFHFKGKDIGRAWISQRNH